MSHDAGRRTNQYDVNRERRATFRKRRVSASPGDLISWMTSLPWIVELQVRDRTSRRRELRIECAPLGISCSWAIVIGSETGPQPVRVQLVLPDTLQLVVTVAGWFSSVVPTSDGCCLCELDLEGRHRAELEVVVLSAYSFAFPPPATDDDDEGLAS